MNEHSPGPVGSGARTALAETGRRGLMRAGGGGDLALAYNSLGQDVGHSAYAELWHIIMKWRWVVLGVMVAALALAAVISIMTTKIYQATSTLEIAAEEFRVIDNKDSATASMSMARIDYLRTQYGLLASRSLAERVARSLNLASVPGFGYAEGAEPTRNIEQGNERAAMVLSGGFDVEPVVDSRLVNISFSGADRQMAVRITNAYATSFIESTLDRKMGSTTITRDLLAKRLETTKQRLELSERAATDYARQAGIINIQPAGPGGATGGETSLTSASLVELNSALSDAQRDRIAAEQRYRARGTTTEEVSNPTIQALQQQKATLTAQYGEMSNLYRDNFPQMEQMRSRLTEIDRSIASERGRVRGALQSEYQAAAARESALSGRVSSLKGSVMNINDASIRYNILRREVDTNRQLYDALLQRFKEVDVGQGITASNISVVDEAKSAELVKPNIFFNMGVGLLLGLVLGLLGAFICEFMDDSIKTPDDVVNKLRLALLGAIPKLPAGEKVVDKIGESQGPVAEAYFSVRTAIEFGTSSGAPRTILVTSARPGEGKSVSAYALATAFARTGSRVLLVDADMRKPTLKIANDDNHGFSNLLAGSDDLDGAIFSTSTDNLWLLPSGPVPPNPAELLASRRTAETLAMLLDRFDIILIDGPPVMGLADSPLLSSLAEGTVFVLESGIRRLMARRAIGRLEAADAQMLGGLLTKFNARMSGLGYGGYGYGNYGYGYGEGVKDQRSEETRIMIDDRTAV